jgi:hypothetical protein
MRFRRQQDQCKAHSDDRENHADCEKIAGTTPRDFD